MKKYIDVAFLLKLLAVLLLLLVACKFTMGIAFSILIPIAIYCVVMFNNIGLMFLVMLSTFGMGFNGFFLPKTMWFVVSQKILLIGVGMVLCVQVFGRRQSKVLTPLWGLVPYLIYMALVSQWGWAPTVSNLKLCLYSVVFFALLGSAVRSMNEKTDLRRLRSVVWVIILFIVVGSILVWPFPGISYMSGDELLRNPDASSLYKGTTNHSQSLGVMSAVLGTYMFADWLFLIQRKSKLYLTLLICVVILLYVSASRTAMASFIFGVGFATFCATRKGMLGVGWRKRVTSSLIGLVVVGAIIVMCVPQLRDKATRFVVKQQRQDVVLDKQSVLSSRQGKLDESLYNWHQSPIVGNGFQVTEEMKYIKVNGIKDMLSAPVEKSTWVYAILEEGGVVGMIIFCCFVMIALWLLVHRGAYMTATMFATMLMINMGEFSMFSMSGDGGFLWNLIFLATVFDFKRIQFEKRIGGQMRGPVHPNLIRRLP